VVGASTTSVMLSQRSVTVFQLKTVTPKADVAILGRFANRTVKYSVSDAPPINTPKAVKNYEVLDSRVMRRGWDVAEVKDNEGSRDYSTNPVSYRG
jgi:hypothetical protein